MIKDDINNIKKYYKDKDNLLIVGLGDDRGVNFQKNLLLLLKETLMSDNYNIDTIDAFSMLFNKNRHIDYYLDHNIGTDQLKKIQMYGTENEIKHALGDKKFGTLVGVIGSYLIKSANEKNLYLSDEIKNNKEPIIVYSSGINDIMYETEINPFSVKSKYKNQRELYDYSVSLVKNENKEKTMNKILDGHKSNFEKILGLNEQAKLCALGAYLYSDNTVYNEPFHNFVLSYNEYLKDLCKEYKIIYVGTRSVEKTDYRGASNTYFRHVPYILASRIINELSFNIEKERNINVDPLEYNSEGAYGILRDMYDYKAKVKKISPVKYLKVEEELEREEKTIKRVMY